MADLEKKCCIPVNIDDKNYVENINKLCFEIASTIGLDSTSVARIDIACVVNALSKKRNEILKKRSFVIEKLFLNLPLQKENIATNFSIYIFNIIKKHKVDEFKKLLKLWKIDLSDEDYSVLKVEFSELIGKLNFFWTKDEKKKKEIILTAIKQKLIFDVINDYVKNKENIKYVRSLFVDNKWKITFYKSQVFQRYISAYHIFWDKERLYYNKWFYLRWDIKNKKENTQKYKMNKFYSKAWNLLTISEWEIIYDGADKPLWKKWNSKAKEIFVKKYKWFLDKLDGRIKIDGISLADFMVSLIKIETIYWTYLNSITNAKWIMQLTNDVFKDFKQRPKAFYETLKSNIKKIWIENISPVFVQKALYAIVHKTFDFDKKECRKEFEEYVNIIQNFIKNPNFQKVYFHKLNMLIWITYFQSRFKETKKLSYPIILDGIKNSNKDINIVINMAKAFDKDVKDKITKKDVKKIIEKIKLNAKLRILFYALRNYNWQTNIGKWEKYEHRYYYALTILVNAYKNAGKI